MGTGLVVVLQIPRVTQIYIPPTLPPAIHPNPLNLGADAQSHDVKGC